MKTRIDFLCPTELSYSPNYLIFHNKVTKKSVCLRANKINKTLYETHESAKENISLTLSIREQEIETTNGNLSGFVLLPEVTSGFQLYKYPEQLRAHCKNTFEIITKVKNHSLQEIGSSMPLFSCRLEQLQFQLSQINSQISIINSQIELKMSLKLGVSSRYIKTGTHFCDIQEFSGQLCIYNSKEDPRHDHCLQCGNPHERK